MKHATVLILAVVGVLALMSGCADVETDECTGAYCQEATYPWEDPGEPVAEPGEEQTEVIPVVDPEESFVNPEPARYDYGIPAKVVLPDPAEGKTPPGPAGITVNDLTPQELEKVEVMRDSIDFGLDVGRLHYLESVSIALQTKGLAFDYEQEVAGGYAGLEEPPEPCPFAKYYDNGFEPSGDTCDYLADVAKVEVYSELTQIIDQYDLPEHVQASTHLEEAHFWYEQGTISGVEEERVKVKFDMKQKEICNAKPTPKESSFEKGQLIGRQHFAQKFNAWLAANGYTADYPVMSQPIVVCNADVSMLGPAKADALATIELKAQQQPLCEGYEAPTLEGKQQYALAEIDYVKAIKKGIEDEFSVASVKVFQVIPCNVSDPLVIDLDGDGLELMPIHRGVNFDLYGTGEQAVAWVAPDDGFIVLDRNHNGRIDNGLELFGNVDRTFADGFHHLSTLDADMDGFVTPRDPGFDRLLVWKDANSDGKSQEGELASLEALGVNSLSLDAVDALSVSAGNRIPKVGWAAGGAGYLVGDAFLASAPYARLSR